MSSRVWDTVVLGAGVLGCATAMHIKLLAPESTVLLLDRNPRPAMGNTRKSVALFRDLFTSRASRDMVLATIALLDHVQDELGYRLDLKRYGYYWMMDEERYRAMSNAIGDLRVRGSEVEQHGRDGVSERLGELLVPEPASIDGRSLPHVDHAILVQNAGTVSPTRLALWYESEFRRLGGEVEYGFKVDRLALESERGGSATVWEGARVSAVEGPLGRRAAVELVVAAGAWTPSLLDPIGVDCHVKPQTRQVFGLKGPGVDALHAENHFPGSELPVIVLPAGGVYLKPIRAQGLLVVGCADRWGRAYALEDDPRPEPRFLDNQIGPVLTAYLPGLRGAEVPVSWAGQYHYNTLDGNPYIFKESNITVAVGSSGSGIMKSDSIGRVAAAVHAGNVEAKLFDGTRVRVANLGVRSRNVEEEKLII